MMSKRDIYLYEQAQKQEKRKRELIGLTKPRVNEILRPMARKVNANRINEQVNAYSEQPYRTEFQLLTDEMLEKYPDQSKEDIEEIIESAVLSLPYVESLSEYPMHIWIEPTEEEPRLVSIKKRLDLVDDHLATKQVRYDNDLLVVKDDRYEDHWLCVYPDGTCTIDEDYTDPDGSTSIELNTFQDCSSIIYYAQLAKYILNLRGKYE